MSFIFQADAFKGDKKFMFTVLGCKDLPDTDGMLNKTDPYLRVKVAGNPTKKTPTIKGSLNPVFKKDNSFVFTGGVGTWVEVICMDWDPLSKDDVVIKGSILLTEEILKGEVHTVEFQGATTKSVERPSSNTSVIFRADAFKGDKKFMFTVLGCKDLPDTDGMLNKTDPYLRVKVAGNPTKKTSTIKGSLNPVFKKDNSFVFTGGVDTWVEVICMDWDPLSNDDVVIKGSILLTEEILKGEVQTVEFQGADESGKFIFVSMAAAMAAAGAFLSTPVIAAAVIGSAGVAGAAGIAATAATGAAVLGTAGIVGAAGIAATAATGAAAIGATGLVGAAAAPSVFKMLG